LRKNIGRLVSTFIILLLWRNLINRLLLLLLNWHINLLSIWANLQLVLLWVHELLLLLLLLLVVLGLLSLQLSLQIVSLIGVLAHELLEVLLS